MDALSERLLSKQRAARKSLGTCRQCRHIATLGLLLVISLALGCQRPQPAAEQRPIRAAALLSLSGPAARFDAIKQQALSVASDRIKQLHPQVQIELQVLDAGGGPESTLASVRRAIEWNAQYFLTGTSPTALAVARDIRDRTPLPVHLANAANPDFGPPRPAEYRFWPDWRQEADTIIQIVDENKIAKVLLIHSADPYSEALTREFRELNKSRRNLTVTELQYDPASTPDFRPALIRAKREATGALIVFGLPPGIQALFSQLAETQWTSLIVGGVNTNLALAAYDSAKLSAPLWLIETEAMRSELPRTSEASQFRSAYRQRFGEAPPFQALYLADALYFIAQGWSAKPDANLPEGERARAVRSFDGASGRIEVTEEGVLRFVMSPKRAR